MSRGELRYRIAAVALLVTAVAWGPIAFVIGSDISWRYAAVTAGLIVYVGLFTYDKVLENKDGS